MKGSHLKIPPSAPGKRANGVLFLVLFLCFLVAGCNRPRATGTESDKIDTSEDPVQVSIISEEPIVIQLKKGEFKLTPVAEYRIAALVVGTETYSYGWNARISPVDLALAWGKLAEPESRKYVTYSMGGRWVSFRLKEGCPLNLAYVTSHASNNHIIPSSRNLWRAVKTIKEKEKVVLEGFLVRMSGTYDGKTVWWNTSLSRTDSGDGSCELIYLTKARIGNRVYE